jgi:hypothetical protein
MRIQDTGKHFTTLEWVGVAALSLLVPMASKAFDWPEWTRHLLVVAPLAIAILLVADHLTDPSRPKSES